MIYRRMYMGYGYGITFKDNKDVITCSAARYEDKVFIYYETENEALEISDVAVGDMKKFPNGDSFVRMIKVYQTFTPESDKQYKRNVKKKQPKFRINFLKTDSEQSYITYHTELQYSNPVDCDKFFSIFLYGNLAIIYNEEPREFITWQDIEGRLHTPQADNWDELMNAHFIPRDNEDISWQYLENI